MTEAAIMQVCQEKRRKISYFCVESEASKYDTEEKKNVQNAIRLALSPYLFYIIIYQSLCDERHAYPPELLFSKQKRVVPHLFVFKQ